MDKRPQQAQQADKQRKKRLGPLKEAPHKLGIKAKAVIGTLASSYMTGAIFLTRMMQHSAWLIWASLISFLVTTWTVWVEFRPKTMPDLRSTRPFVGERFLGGLFAALNLFIIARVIWHYQGSAPYHIEFQQWFYVLFVALLLLFPISIWASGMLVKKR